MTRDFEAAYEAAVATIRQMQDCMYNEVPYPVAYTPRGSEGHDPSPRWNRSATHHMSERWNAALDSAATIIAEHDAAKQRELLAIRRAQDISQTL